MENTALKDAFSKVALPDLPDIAEINRNDSQISGGRMIVRQKENTLFTGQFEKSDMDEFIAIWQQYRNDPKMINGIKSRLMRQANAMIRNYRGAVCPIELMLYTSNVAASSFGNLRLISEVAETVYLILRGSEKYFQSVKHILEIWKWEQAINICSIAVGKLAADRDKEEDVDLLRFIYDTFHYQKIVNYGCFRALMESKKEVFVVDILNMIHDLKGDDEDKPIGKFFRENFGQYFPTYYNRIDGEMFRDSKPYVQDLVRKMLDPKRNNNLISQYRESLSNKERKNIVNIAMNRILTDDRSGSPYEAVNVLKLASNENISDLLFSNLNFVGKPRQRLKENVLAVICNYFGTINYPPAIKAFMNVPPSSDYYAAVRVALFYQDKISSENIVEDFLTEVSPDKIKVYLSGFFDLQERLPAVRRSIVNYMIRDLEYDKLSTAITNYYQLIKKYRQLYDPQIGSVIMTLFGYKTILGHNPLRIQDQMTCLNIINTIINDANSKSYEDFLFYVAEEELNLSPAVSNLARQILKNLRIGKIEY